MKRAGTKGSQKRKISFTSKEYDEVRQKITTDAVSRAVLVTIAATSKIINLTDEQVGDIVIEFNKIASSIDENESDMIEIQNIIENNTGIRLKGWYE